MKTKQRTLLKGKDITNCRTLGTWNDNGNICVTDSNNKQYRIHGAEIMKLLKNACFVGEKKRTLTHLTIVESEPTADQVSSCADIGFECGKCPHRLRCVTE